MSDTKATDEPLTRMPLPSWVDPAMILPPGKTCADCFHLKRCTWLISVNPKNLVCDWSPSRFREAAT